MTDNPGDSAISRREALRRAAVIGGSAILAAPVVQQLGSLAAHAAVSPPPSSPPSPPPLLTAEGPSNFQVVLRRNGTKYGVKFDPDSQIHAAGAIVMGSFDGIPDAPARAACLQGVSFEDVTDDHPFVIYLQAHASVVFTIDATMDPVRGGYRLTLPADVSFVIGEPADDDGAEVFDGGRCIDDVTVNGDGTYTFWKPE